MQGYTYDCVLDVVDHATIIYDMMQARLYDALVAIDQTL